MGRSSKKPKLPRIEVNGRVLNRPQVSLLRDAAIAESELRHSDARSLYAALERQLGSAADRDWLRHASAEIVQLENLRGNAVEVSERPEHKGRIRVLSRDGLERLKEASSINGAQYAAGLRYRDKFERTEVNLRSCMAGHVAGGGSPGSAATDAVQAKRDVDAWDLAVFAAHRLPREGHDALLALREIAGRGKSLRDIATSGGRRATLLTRLQAALDVVADMLALH